MPILIILLLILITLVFGPLAAILCGVAVATVFAVWLSVIVGAALLFGAGVLLLAFGFLVWLVIDPAGAKQSWREHHAGRRMD